MTAVSGLANSPWLFAFAYIGLVAALLAGLYFLIRYLVARNKPDEPPVFREELDVQASEEVQLDVRLQNLENQLQQLIAINIQLNERLKWVEGQMGVALSRGTFGDRKATTEEQVCQAFEQGKTVSELAHQFGRSKGEIELMLNLRRIRRGGVR
ncbi:MAG: hypothetical protein RDV00_10325 [Clostridia bacterium]|nr:hypothetical protein [Clostridia bacterium]MDQ7792497.1 hypothetical protein [Clostridia bacterium]